VRRAIEGRLAAASSFLSKRESKDYLEAQWRFTEQNGIHHLQEIEGIAKGYGLPAQSIFDFLHTGFIAAKVPPIDGCSTIALSRTAEGPLIAKNRDYRGEHKRLQRVFLHHDPAFGDKRCLFVGSLGCPGAFSSGMNSAGLALVDTRVDWPRPGVGWLRYFLMTELLWQTDTVAEAVEYIRSVPHVGGGSLALADASGCIATVEIGSVDVVAKTAQSGGFVHTNHYRYEPLAAAAIQAGSDATSRSSAGRLAILESALPGLLNSCAGRQDLQALLSSHGTDDDSLCRHGHGGDDSTISSVVYSCRAKELAFTGGNPCRDDWQTFAL
jgi:predicted choloylglycine hydrolase